MSKTLTVVGQFDHNNITSGLKKCEASAKNFATTMKKNDGIIAESLNNTYNLLSDVKFKLEKVAKVAASKLAIASVIGSVGVAFKKASELSIDFEQKLSQLGSLTGLSKAQINGMSGSIIDLSRDFKSSASDIVESMKLIGSQSPEMLKDKNALLSVTKAANTLAEAGLMEVKDAASGITTIMNQMGVSSAEVEEIINSLAAGAKEGAADVQYLKTVFEKSGTQAKSMGLGYHDLIALTESVAGKFSSADVAGTALNGTLLALSTSTKKEFNPAQVGLKKALDNLYKAQLSDKKIKDLVGASNITMLKTLIDMRDVYSDMKNNITGTNEAFEQASRNNDNVAGSLSKLSSTWESFLLKLNGSNGILKKSLDLLTNIIHGYEGAFASSKESRENRDKELEKESKYKVAKKEYEAALEYQKNNPNNDAAAKEVARTLKNLKLAEHERYGTNPAAFNKTTGEMLSDKELKETVAGFKYLIGREEKSLKLLENSSAEVYNRQHRYVSKLKEEYEKKFNTEKREDLPEDTKYYGEDSIEGLKNLISRDSKLLEKARNDSDREKYRESISRYETLLSGLTEGDKEKRLKHLKEEEESLLDKMKAVNIELRELAAEKTEKGILTTEDENKLNALIETQEDLGKRISKVKADIKEINGIVVQGLSLGYYTDKLNEVNSTIKDTSSVASSYLDKLKEQRTELEIQKEALEKYVSSLTRVEEAEKKLELLKRENFSLRNETVKDYFGAKSIERRYDRIDSMQNPFSKADSIVASTLKASTIDKQIEQLKIAQDSIRMMSGVIDKTSESWKEAERSLKLYAEAQRQLEIEKKTAQINDYTSAAKTMGDVISTYGNDTVSALGKVITTTAEAISKIWALAAANAAVAGAEAIEEGAKQPWPANIGAMASAAAAAVAAISAVYSASKTFADGGIIQGNTTVGDRQLARVNSGEMILNSTQQGRLFRILDGERLANSGQKGYSGNVQFRISGGDLVGVLNNYDKKYNKI